jgi:hypothetical protein
MSTVTLELPDSVAAALNADMSRAVELLKAAYGYEEEDNLNYDKEDAVSKIENALSSLKRGEPGEPLVDFITRRRQERNSA